MKKPTPQALAKGAVIVIAAVLVVGAGLAVANHYKEYQNKKNHDQIVEAQTAKKHADEQAAQLAKYQAAYSAVHLECEKGAAAYASLTSISKTKIQAPTCGPAIVQ